MGDNLPINLETITPGYAMNLLSRQVHSRHTKNRIVEAYAKDMRDGKWFLDG